VKPDHRHRRVLRPRRERPRCMSPRADRCRERAAEAKDRAAQARDPFIKSAFENVAAGWVGPVRDEEK
jgi:hypothetical protein